MRDAFVARGSPEKEMKKSRGGKDEQSALHAPRRSRPPTKPDHDHTTPSASAFVDIYYVTLRATRVSPLLAFNPNYFTKGPIYSYIPNIRENDSFCSILQVQKYSDIQIIYLTLNCYIVTLRTL